MEKHSQFFALLVLKTIVSQLFDMPLYLILLDIANHNTLICS